MHMSQNRTAAIGQLIDTKHLTVVYTEMIVEYLQAARLDAARSREINLTPHSPRVGAVRAALADRRGEVRTNTGDQTGHEGGQKTSKTKSESTSISKKWDRTRLKFCHPRSERNWTRMTGLSQQESPSSCPLDKNVRTLFFYKLAP